MAGSDEDRDSSKRYIGPSSIRMIRSVKEVGSMSNQRMGPSESSCSRGSGLDRNSRFQNRPTDEPCPEAHEQTGEMWPHDIGDGTGPCPPPEDDACAEPETPQVPEEFHDYTAEEDDPFAVEFPFVDPPISSGLTPPDTVPPDDIDLKSRHWDIVMEFDDPDLCGGGTLPYTRSLGIVRQAVMVLKLNNEIPQLAMK